MRRAAVLLLVLAAAACEPGARGETGALAAREAALAATRPTPSDTTFPGLVAGLSEPGGYFDTDNLISNESSYLHALPGLDSAGLRGGAYLGVGPDQNFSYIAALRPSIAFLVDIRRDNLLQHLWFRALFAASESRLDYLCLMVARRCGGPSASLGVEALVARVDDAPPVADLDSLVHRVVDAAAAYGVPLDSADRATIRRIHHRFADAGLNLRFTTHGRAPRSYYPTLRRLVLERDRAGRSGSYLADEERWEVVRALEAAGRVVPVVGDLAGPHAVRAIGAVLRERGERVTAFYVSNVEFYLFGDGVFPSYVANLATLPLAENAMVIRSVFRGPPIPGTVPGYASTQSLHAAAALLRQWEEGRIRSYGDLVRAPFRD